MQEVDYPDNTLRKELEKRNIPIQSLWQMKGPENTNIAWIECLAVGAGIVLVHTYSDGDGWDAFSNAPTINIDETVEDVKMRCGIVEGA